MQYVRFPVTEIPQQGEMALNPLILEIRGGLGSDFTSGNAPVYIIWKLQFINETKIRILFRVTARYLLYSLYL